MSQIKDDIPAAGRFADRLVKMSEQYDIGFTLVAGRACQAYVTASHEPRNQDLLDAFEEHMTLYHEQVSGLSKPLFLSLRARLYLAAERYEEAEAVLMKAADLIATLDDRYSAAEVYRLQGELQAVTGRGDAQGLYQRAVAVAAEQETRMLQLRAAVDLCRLWQRQGRQEEAQRLLSDLYGWFSEGWATSELQAARALLNELALSQDANMAGWQAAPPGRMNG
jgi:tetratricopeptide (TPR) repeat protein